MSLAAAVEQCNLECTCASPKWPQPTAINAGQNLSHTHTHKHRRTDWGVVKLSIGEWHTVVVYDYSTSSIIQNYRQKRFLTNDMIGTHSRISCT